MAFIDIPVPDLGDIDDAAIIEILVKPGQTVAAEQSLITLESDKASMEVPSPQAGVVGEIKVKLGDRVGQGHVILTLDVAGASASAAAPAASPAGSTPSGAAATALAAATSTAPASSPPAPQAAAASGSSSPAGASSTPARGAESARAPVATPTDTDCDVLVLGGGPGGYSAAFRAADLGLKVILVERYAELGGVCLNVGCIPSKALLHVAAVMDEVKHFDALGVSFGEPKLDLAKLRAHKSGVTSKLTQGLVGMAKARKVEVVRGYGSLVDAHTLKVELTTGNAQDKTGETRQLRFKRAILAAGSQALHPAVLADVDSGVGYRHLLDLGLAKPELKLLDDITCPWCSTGMLHQVCRAPGVYGGNAYRGLCLSCGWQNIPAALLEVGRVYRFSAWQTLTRIVLPATTPALFTGLRQGVMQAWLTTIFVELLSSSEGLGFFMSYSRSLSQIDMVIVSMFAIGVLGIVIELALRLIESRLQGWRRNAF